VYLHLINGFSGSEMHLTLSFAAHYAAACFVSTLQRSVWQHRIAIAANVAIAVDTYHAECFVSTSRCMAAAIAPV